MRYGVQIASKKLWLPFAYFTMWLKMIRKYNTNDNQILLWSSTATAFKLQMNGWETKWKLLGQKCVYKWIIRNSFGGIFCMGNVFFTAKGKVYWRNLLPLSKYFELKPFRHFSYELRFSIFPAKLFICRVFSKLGRYLTVWLSSIHVMII